MMFRNIEEEDEESASDWDDLSSHISPQPHPKTLPRGSPPSHHQSSTPVAPSSVTQTTIVQEMSSAMANGNFGSLHQSTPPKMKSGATGNGIEFDSLSPRQEQAIGVLSTSKQTESGPPHPPPPHLQHLPQTKYTLQQRQPSPPPPPPSATSRSLITVQHNPTATTYDEPPVNFPIRPPSVESDEHNLQPNRGKFQFDAIADSRKLRVERESHMQTAVMAGYANKSEKAFSRVFQECFSLLRICTDLIIVFILECAHCFAFHILRKLLCGLLFTCLSAVFIPGLTDCYNVIVWPVALFTAQMCRAGQLVLRPCGECLDWLTGRCVEIVTAFKPVNIVPSHHSRAKQ